MKVFIIAALTADGFIGRDSNHLADWTGHDDKMNFVRLTKEAGVIVMGSRTFATLGRALPGRRTIVYTRQPANITASDVESTSEAPTALIKRLENEGAHGLAIIGGAIIYDLFMKAGVVDELYITITPILFGQGIPLFTNKLTTQLRLIESRELSDGAMLLHFAVVKY